MSIFKDFIHARKSGFSTFFFFRILLRPQNVFPKKKKKMYIFRHKMFFKIILRISFRPQNVYIQRNIEGSYSDPKNIDLCTIFKDLISVSSIEVLCIFLRIIVRREESSQGQWLWFYGNIFQKLQLGILYRIFKKNTLQYQSTFQLSVA